VLKILVPIFDDVAHQPTSFKYCHNPQYKQDNDKAQRRQTTFATPSSTSFRPLQRSVMPHSLREDLRCFEVLNATF
jgi:hypothetical protein